MAVYSETDIANRALSMLGDTRITDIAQTNTKAARAMNHRFPFLRDLLLQSYPWRFAMELDSLAADATAPVWGFSTRYLLPGNCLRLVTVGDYSVNIEAYGLMFRASTAAYASDAPFEVIGQYIHTDLSAPLKVQYIQQITDTAQFHDIFSQALACALAEDAAEELTQSRGKKEYAMGKFMDAIKEAKRVDALQRPPGTRAPGGWMMSRLG